MFFPIMLILSGLLGFAASLSAATPQALGEVVAVDVVQHRNYAVLGGTVVPVRQATIAAQLPGRVQFIAGIEGDRFARDAVLVSLDDDELLAQRRAALAQMNNADAALRNAGVQFNRELVSPRSRSTLSGMGVPGLFDQMFTRNFSDVLGYQSSGAERGADLYARSVGIEQARGAFLQAQSRLDEIDAKLRDVTGTAPFDGVIVKKSVEIGDTVQPGVPLLEFADTRFLQIRIEVPARLVPGIREGDIVVAELDVNERPVDVKVAQIFPMADTRRHTVTVKFDLPIDAPAAPGMYAEVKIEDVNAPVQMLPVIPRSSLVQRGSLPVVFVVTASGETELRMVRVGAELDPGRVRVISGLSGGEQILNNPRPGLTSRPR